MNPRIEKLAKKAGFNIIQNEVYTSKLEHLPITEDMEKFVQIIVQECAKICDDLQNIPATEPRHCAEDIRIHFGVKE